MSTKCIDCDGTGEVQYPDDDGTGDIIEQCERCGGSGDEPEEG